MAVDHWELVEMPSGEAGESDSRTMRWRAHTTDRMDGPGVVLGYFQCPAYGDPLVINGVTYGNFRAQRIRATRIAQTDWRWFDVEAEYETRFSQFSLDAKELAPLDRRAKVKYSTEELTIPLAVDAVTGDLVINTAGDAIAGLTRRVMCDVWTINNNVGSYPYALLARRGTVNSAAAAIYGVSYPAKRLWFRSLSIDELQVDKNQQHYPVTAVLVGTPLPWGWQQHVLNAGLDERVSGNGGTVTRRCQINGKEVDQPVPLDSNGKMIAPATLKADPLNSPHYLDFNEFGISNFAQLALPPSPPL